MAGGVPVGEHVAPAPGPADVGIVAALPIEVGPLREALGEVRTYESRGGRIVEGYCGDRLVAMIIAGTGPALARRGAEVLIAGHRPRWIVSTGFGGALRSGLPRDRVVLVRELLNGVGSDHSIKSFDLDALVGSERPPAWEEGRLVTVDQIAWSRAMKAELRARHGADVVDMESASVAQVAEERGLPFLGVRVVSDLSDEDLPKEILSIVGPTGGFRLGAAIGSIWKRPGSVMDLWELRGHAYSASEALARAVPEVIARLTRGHGVA